MSRTDAFEIILEPMQAIYLAPKEYAGTDEKAQGAMRAALDGYGDVLKNFERDELHYARTAVFEAHDKRSWPLPSAFAKEARKCALAKKPSGSPGGGRVRIGEVDRQIAWAEWMGARLSPIVADAVTAQCSWSLKCAILDGKKLDGINLAQLVVAHRRCIQHVEDIENCRPIFNDRFPKPTIITEPARTAALTHWRGVLINEALTQEEVRRARLRVGVEHEPRGYLPGVDPDEIRGLLV